MSLGIALASVCFSSIPILFLCMILDVITLKQFLNLWMACGIFGSSGLLLIINCIFTHRVYEGQLG
jgi:drug/metabolite transporter (DMT)-like permease